MMRIIFIQRTGSQFKMTNDQFKNQHRVNRVMTLQEVTWHRVLGEEVHVPESAVLGAEQARHRRHGRHGAPQRCSAGIPRQKLPEFSTSGD